MLRLAWATDVHLNFLSGDELSLFYEKFLAKPIDGVLLTGDIAEAPSLAKHLSEFSDRIKKPIYFVLGNHDFYRSSIRAVRAQITRICEENEFLVWLPLYGVVPLSKKTALVGHDGWADGRFGDYAASPVLLNDYVLIEELVGLEK